MILAEHLKSRLEWAHLWCRTHNGQGEDDTAGIEKLEALTATLNDREAQAEEDLVPYTKITARLSDEEKVIFSLLIGAVMMPPCQENQPAEQGPSRRGRPEGLKLGELASMMYGARIDRLCRVMSLLREGGPLDCLGIRLEMGGESVDDHAASCVEMPFWLYRAMFGESVSTPCRQETAPVVLPGGEWERIQRVIDAYQNGSSEVANGSLVFLLTGRPGTGKTTLAWKIARHLDRTVFYYQNPDIGIRTSFSFPSAFKKAALHQGILIFDGIDELVNKEGSMRIILPLLDSHRVVVILVASTACRDESLTRRCLVRIHLKVPDADMRKRIWEIHLDRVPAAPDISIETLARTFPLTGGLIANAVRDARCTAASQDSVVTNAHLMEAAFYQGRNERMDAKNRIVVPQARLSELVLPPKTRVEIEKLAQILHTGARIGTSSGCINHSMSGQGITAMFAGPSGTGKTHTAEALANEAGLRFRVVRWTDFLGPLVGITEDHINNFFDNLDSESLYLIDEAEGLLSARENAIRSWELSQIDVLLARIEQSSGNLIFSTNCPDRIDSAFERRILYRIYFPLPNEEGRAEILDRLLKAYSIPFEKESVISLARRFAFSGGQLAVAARRSHLLARAEDRVPTVADLESELAAGETVTLSRTSNRVGFLA